MFLVGVLLDLLHDGGAGDQLSALYALDSFRIAFLAQFPIIGLGLTMLLVVRRRMRRSLRTDEGITIAPLWLATARRLRRRGASDRPDDRDVRE